MIKKTISKVLAGLLVSGLLTSATSAVYAENKVGGDVNSKLESIIKKLPKKGEVKFLQIDKILKEVLKEEVKLGNITQDESDKISEYLAKKIDKINEISIDGLVVDGEIKEAILLSEEELPEEIKNKIGKIKKEDFVLTGSAFLDIDSQEIENGPEKIGKHVDGEVNWDEIKEAILLSEDELSEKIKNKIGKIENGGLVLTESGYLDGDLQEIENIQEGIKISIDEVIKGKAVGMKKGISDLEDIEFIGVSDIDIFSELVEERIISQEKADGIRVKFMEKLKELKK